MASPGDGTTTLGGGTAISGSGTPDTGCGTPFRPVPAEFNHCPKGFGASKFWRRKKQILYWVASKLRSYFSPFVNQSSPDYVIRCGRDRSLQRRFPIIDIFFHSGYIRDRSAIFGYQNGMYQSEHVPIWSEPKNVLGKEKPWTGSHCHGLWVSIQSPTALPMVAFLSLLSGYEIKWGLCLTSMWEEWW